MLSIKIPNSISTNFIRSVAFLYMRLANTEEPSDGAKLRKESEKEFKRIPSIDRY